MVARLPTDPVARREALVQLRYRLMALDPTIDRAMAELQTSPPGYETARNLAWDVMDDVFSVSVDYGERDELWLGITGVRRSVSEAWSALHAMEPDTPPDYVIRALRRAESSARNVAPTLEPGAGGRVPCRQAAALLRRALNLAGRRHPNYSQLLANQVTPAVLRLGNITLPEDEDLQLRNRVEAAIASARTAEAILTGLSRPTDRVSRIVGALERARDDLSRVVVAFLEACAILPSRPPVFFEGLGETGGRRSRPATEEEQERYDDW